MKKFVIKCVVFFLIITIIFVPFAMILDPYNIFHADNLVNNGVEPDKNYFKPLHVMNNPDKYDSFLFGSSRVGFMDVTRMTDGTYYDMMASEGLPAEHVAVLKAFIKRGIIPKNVIVGVDDISYFVDPANHDGILYRQMFPWDGTFTDKLGFYLRYMDPITNFQSIETMRDHDATQDPDWGKRLLDTGTENLDIISDFNPDNNKPYWADYYMPREEVFDDLQELVDICEENDIKLTVFTNPLFGYTYMQDIENGYLVFLERLADITPYYNFSGFNNLTLDSSNYYENSHYTRAIGDQMIKVMFEGETDETLLSQGFGFYVTKDNKGELLEILNGQAVNFDIKVNTYKDTLNKPEENDEE